MKTNRVRWGETVGWLRRGVRAVAALAALSWLAPEARALSTTTLSFEGQTVAHFSYDLTAPLFGGETLVEPLRLTLSRDGGPYQVVATAAAANPGRLVGDLRVTGTTPGMWLHFRMTWSTVQQGSGSESVGGATLEPTGRIGGTPLFDETLVSLPVAPPSVSLTVPQGRSVTLMNTSVAGAIYLNSGAGKITLDGVSAAELTSPGPSSVVGELTARNCIFTGAVHATTTGALTVENCFFRASAGLQSAAALSVTGSDFYHLPAGGSSSLQAPASQFSVRGSVFTLAPQFTLLGLGSQTTLAIQDNSFLQGLAPQVPGGSLPAGVSFGGNYWGGAKGPRTGGLRWLDGYGGPCGLEQVTFGFESAGAERATNHTVDIAPSRVFVAQHQVSQNVSGGLVRKGRETLVACDVRTWYGTRSSDDLRLRIGTTLLAPVEHVTIVRDWGVPTAASGNGRRTVNFVIPPSQDTLIEFEVLDTTRTELLERRLASGTIVQSEAPDRPLRLAVLPVVIDGYGTGFMLKGTGTTSASSLRKHMAAMLPLKPSEIEIDVLPEARYRLGYSALYVLVSRGYMLNECSAVLRGHLTRLNAARAEPYDFLVAVVPRGTLGTDALGVNLPFRREVIMVDEVSPESAIHELGHALGVGNYNTVEQYTVLWDGYDDAGVYYKSGFGARVEGCTGFIPPDAAIVPPMGARVRHFPHGVDSSVWDIMGGDGAQWITPATHADYGHLLLSMLQVPSPSPPAARQKRDAPPAGTRRLLLHGLLEPTMSPHGHFPLMRESVHCGVAPAGMGPVADSSPSGLEFAAYDAAGTRIFVANCLRRALGGVVQPWVQTFDVPVAAVRYEIADLWTREVVFIQRAVPGLAIALGPPQFASDARTAELSWIVQGTHPSLRPLSVQLHSSTDGGTTWRHLGDHDDLTSASVASETWAGAAQVRFKASVTDGFSVQESVSPPLTPPALPVSDWHIEQPWDGAAAPVGTPWTFAAGVTQERSGQTVTWASSLDGTLGTGPSLTGRLLSLGQHTITATLTEPGRPTTVKQLALSAGDRTDVDLTIPADALTVAVSGLDPIQGSMTRFPVGKLCRVTVRVDNPGAAHTARVILTVQAPGGSQTAIRDETFHWIPLTRHECTGEFTAAVQGVHVVRAFISHEGPPSVTETQTGNNSRTWLVGNAAPVPRGGSVTVREGQPLAIALTADDAEGGALTYAVTDAPDYGTLSGTAPNVVYQPAAGFTGEDAFAFTASDGATTGSAATIRVRVVPAPPRFLSPLTATAEQHHPFSYVADARGTGVSVGVSFPPLLTGLTFDAATRTVTGTVTRLGTFGLLFSVENAAGRLEPNVQLTVLPNDDPPQLTSERVVVSRVGEAVSYLATGNYAPTSYQFTGLPAGVWGSEGGWITGTPEVSGVFPVRVGITNSAGTGWSEMELRVGTNSQPPGFAPNSVHGAVGQPLSWPLRVLNEPSWFAASELPVGLTLDAATGLVSGVPLQGGSFFANVQAGNRFGSSSGLVVFSIDLPAGYPQITNPGAQAVTGRVPVSLPIAATPGPLAFVAEGLPAGLSIHPTTGVISGTTGRAGDYSVVVRATNAAGASAVSFALLVAPGPGMPVITSSPVLNGTLGDAVDLLLTATNGGVFSAADLPDGLAVNPSTGRLTGRLKVAGTRYATLVATNASGQSTQRLLLQVSATYAGWATLFAFPAGKSAATSDADGDGAINALEYLANSDPLRAESRPLFIALTGTRYGGVVYRTRPATSGDLAGAFTSGGLAAELQVGHPSGTGLTWLTQPDEFGAGTAREQPDGTVEVRLPALNLQSLPAQFMRLRAIP